MELRRNREVESERAFTPRAGEICWRVERAPRFACPVDGAPEALRDGVPGELHDRRDHAVGHSSLLDRPRLCGPSLARTLLLTLALGVVWAWFRPFVAVPISSIAAVGLFALAASAFVPLTPLVLASVLTFGTGAGSSIAFLGALASALLNFGLGALLGQGAVARSGGACLSQIAPKLCRRGASSVALLRILPIAPAALVGLACGAARVDLRVFAAGTALALLPVVAACALLGARLIALVRDPGPMNLVLVLAVAVALVSIANRLDRYVSDHALRGDAHAD